MYQEYATAIKKEWYENNSSMESSGKRNHVKWIQPTLERVGMEAIMPTPSKDEDKVQNQDCPEGYICTYARDFSNEIEVANKLLNAEYLIQNLNDKTYGAT